MSEVVKRIKAFNKRWGIVSDLGYKEEFSKFKKRVLNIFHDVDQHVSDAGIRDFCQILGIREKWETPGYQIDPYSENIINALTHEEDEKRFYFILQVISYLPILDGRDRSYSGIYNRDLLFDKLSEAIELSNVNLAITIKGGEVVLYPAGEKTLDEKIVDNVLVFLSGVSQEHFIDALKFYQDKKPHKSAESLRRALEEFLRVKLNNIQGLDKNINELQKKLKTSDVTSEIRNVIHSVFDYMDKFFNENSKHHDGTIRESENEYLIYQVGLLMRYIQKSI